MPEDLILKARVESLTASLEKVQHLLDLVTRRQKCLEDVTTLVRESGDAVGRCSKLIDSYIHPQWLEAKAEDNVSQELNQAGKGIEDLQRIAGKLKKEGQEKIGALSKICHIGERGAAQQIEKNFGTEAGTTLTALEDLDQSDPKAWLEYETKLLPPAQSLFTEFSEFLAGLALRDSGFEEDICEIADELLKSCQSSSGTSTDMLTIPIPRELVRALRNIIYLSYQEWSVWSLPMAAHEFWRTFAARQPEVSTAFQRLAPGLATNDPQLCLADAFAACTMGPAYAWYAFFLSLNPVNALADSPAGPAPAKRAEAILAMLEWMNQRTVSRPWSGIIGDLRRDWTTAMANAREKKEEAGSEGAAATDLPPEVKETLKRSAAALGRALYEQTDAAFRPDTWAQVEQWSEHLRKDQVEQIEVDASYEMRWVVNAAWLARLGVPDAEEAGKIAERASALRRRILGAREKAAVKRAAAGRLRG